MVSTRVLRQIQREKVAKEAAQLLYRHITENYFSAKQAAGRNTNTDITD
jgi:hypothetical protein